MYAGNGRHLPSRPRLRGRPRLRKGAGSRRTDGLVETRFPADACWPSSPRAASGEQPRIVVKVATTDDLVWLAGDERIFGCSGRAGSAERGCRRTPAKPLQRLLALRVRRAAPQWRPELAHRVILLLRRVQQITRKLLAQALERISCGLCGGRVRSCHVHVPPAA
jgi:hypothetical protein